MGRVLRKSIDDLLAALPPDLAQRIKVLCKKSGETPVMIVKKSVGIYERYYKTEDKPLSDQDEKLIRLVPDAAHRSIFREVMKAIGKDAAMAVSEEGRKARAQAGGVARSKNLTPEQYKEMGRKGAEKRWRDKDKQPTTDA